MLEPSTQLYPRPQAVEFVSHQQPQTTVIDGTAVVMAGVAVGGVVLVAVVVTVGVACAYVRIRRHASETTSLSTLVPSQRAATLTEHQSNYYDVLHGDESSTDELRRSYDRPTSTTSVCCDDEYLTPALVTSDTWTTATMQSCDRTANNEYEGLTDSGKYLQLQGSVYYDYI